MNGSGLRNTGIPLGGLGTGSVELRQDGYFHEWQVMNNAPLGTGPAVDVPPDAAFFAIHVQADMQGAAYRRTAVLGLPVEYSGRFSLLGHFLNDPYHMPWLEHAQEIDAKARFPFTNLVYSLGDAFPVSVELQAFSPFIPLDEYNSGLPLACFTFTLSNLTQNRLEVSLLGALRNLSGYSYSEQLSLMTLHHSEDATWMQYSREHLAPDASDTGTLALGTIQQGQTSYVFHPRTSRDIWDPFHKTGRLEDVDIGDFDGPVGNIGAERLAQLRRGLPLGALCQTVELLPGDTHVLTFFLAWHFPNLTEADYPEKKRIGRVIGAHYAARFTDAGDVLEYGALHLSDLRERTARFFHSYYQSSFPDWLLEAVSAQFTTLIKSSWWARDGRFGIWEGLGCCGLQTTDITYYASFPILQFFPSIQRSQMRLTRDNIEIPGKIPHMMPANFSCADADHRGRIDLIPQYILLIWRDVLWSGDLDYAGEMWPSVKEALDYFQTIDTDGDGLPNNTGPDQTYDQFPLKGTSAFVGFLYAASLAACAQLAALLGETQFAAELEQRLSSALAGLEDQLWTGEYYRLCFDPSDGQANDGVMADQVNGDWFLRQASGSGLLSDARVRSALGAVLEFCSAPQGFIANCAWPFGGAIEIGRHTSDQANSPWSGVEYALAAHLVLMGMEEDGLRVVRNVWERYERAGLRFNHIECGANYYRALSAWAVYLALTGFAWDAYKGELTLRARRGSARYVVSMPDAWGELVSSGSRGRLAFNLVEGCLKLTVLHISGALTHRASVTLDGTPAAVSCEFSGKALHLTFEPALILRPDQKLVITLDASPRERAG